MKPFQILCACSLLLCAATSLWAQDPFPPVITSDSEHTLTEPLADDATLHDVRFVDAEFGWAVGDHGVVLHTSDGGQHWHRQRTPVEGDLQGVWFLDRLHGWCVGGTTLPYLWTSQAIVLSTKDGGKSWRQELAFVPALEQVKFFDLQHGVAWGRGSGADPFGLFASDDQGKNWRPVAVGLPGCWRGGDFVDQHNGIVLGPAGQAHQVTAGDAQPLAWSDPTGRSPRAVQFSPTGAGWLVGDAGLIAESHDQGQHWKNIDALPSEVAQNLNWQTLAIRGPHLWVAGEPGSVVLHSSDAGNSWQGHATGVSTPLTKITFVDDTHGWAVGALGAILHTADGGATWQSQRAQGRRSAALVVVSHQNEVPLVTLAKLSADGYRTAVVVVSPRISDHRADANLASLTGGVRFVEALASLGCQVSFAAEAIAPEAQATANPQPLAALVRQIRLWKPSVLIAACNHQDAQLQQQSDSEWIQSAVAQAADDAQYQSLAERLELSPWQVQRILVQLPAGVRGTHRVDPENSTVLSHQSLGDQASTAASLFLRAFTPLRATEEFRLIANLSGDVPGTSADLAAGLKLEPGGDARRAISPSAMLANDPLHRRVVEKQRNLRNIFSKVGGNPALLAQVGPLIADLDSNSGAALLWELAFHFQAAGQPDLQAATFELLSRRYPSDPRVDRALVWLVQYYASSETAHANRQITTAVAQAIAVTPPESAPTDKLTAPEPVTPATVEVASTSLAHQRYTRAVQITQHIAHTRPLLYTEPQVRVPWAVAERKRGFPESAERYLQALALRWPGEAWQTCGEVERWLAKTSDRAPRKPRSVCRFTHERPTLDGDLNEPCWQGDFQISPPDPSILDPPSSTRFAYDEEHLYLAVRCQKNPECEYQSDQRVRSYDADLTPHDRVRILLDVDRDYSTYYALTVDHRGWTNDACWQDTSWNPQWFVAAGGDDGKWTIEAAIPWSELVETPPTPGTAWALGVERFSPQVSPQVELTEPTPSDFFVLEFK